ncbi:tetratricopeptide repeat protein 6 [Rhinophrynus dorsalis]
MSDRNSNLHFRLNYAEEFRIKKEMEKLLKRPQRDFRHVTLESRPGSSSPLFLMQDPFFPPSFQFNSLSSPKCEAVKPSGQSVPGPIVGQEVQSSDHRDKQFNLKPNPLLKNAISSHLEVKQESTDHKEPSTDQSCMLPSNSGINNVKRPAIASVLGTTKPISVFSRPEPPSKPRSYMPQMSSKPRVSKKLHASQKESNKKVTGVATSKLTKTVDSEPRSTPTPESRSSHSSSSSSDSEDSDNSQRKIKTNKTLKKYVFKRTHPSVVCEKDGSVQSKRTIFARSTPRLSLKEFSEGTGTPRTILQDGQNTQESTATDGKISASVQPPVKVRTVDEIIASLRSPHIYTPTATDLMIKQLMESVLGQNYNITFGIMDTQTDVKAEEGVNSSILGKDCEEQIPQLSSSSLVEHRTLSPEERMLEEESKSVLKSPAQVTISDVIHVKGDAAPMTRREPAKTVPPAALLATWEPRSKDRGQQTIHHLCTLSPRHVLPNYLQLSLRVHHTLDRKGHQFFPLEKELPSMVEDSPRDSQSYHTSQSAFRDKKGILQDGVRVSTLQLQNQRGGVTTLPPHSAMSLEEWQKIAEYYIEGPRMELVGEQAQFHSDTLRMFWAPAPPKFSAPLSLIQKTLFSKYETCLEEQDRTEELSSIQQESEWSEDEQEDSEDLAHLKRILSRRYKSLPDIHYSSTSLITYPLKSSLSASAPDVSHHKDINFHLSSDFQTSMKELEIWRQQSFKSSATPKHTPNPDQIISHVADPLLTLPGNSVSTPSPTENLKQINIIPSDSRVPPKPYLKCTTSIKKKKKLKKKKVSLNPLQMKFVFEELNQPPRALERSVSFVRLPVVPRHDYVVQHCHRRNSLPQQLDFSCFAQKHGGVNPNQEVREWVRDIWNNWFDEVFPPSRLSQDEEDPCFRTTENVEKTEQEKVILLAALDSVPLVLVEDPAASVQDLDNEIASLSLLIEGQEMPSGFHCCRRGALYRKLGKLSQAFQDLNLAIQLEPQLLDAFWHRHLIYFLQGKTSEALDDLNTIIKHNKTYTDAYLSKAEIYKQKKEFTMSILSYTQAIRCRPNDDDIYFRRAQMYEAQEEYKIAMDDYAKCFQHNPSRIDALIKHGVYYFENCNWTVAVQDFTALIKQDFNNMEARMYRGRANTKLGNYSEAAEDFSAAIHLDPNNWMAFYYRGCLLRKCHPWQALQDFSVSVLLHDDFENLNAFLHRGILYTDLGMWSEAVYDFERVLALDRTVTLAHMNLGLISLLNRNNFSQAIHHFSAALEVDPIYIRAYLCRAHAYRQINDLHNALKDITRAIHLRPDSPQAYIIRGQYLYEMKKYDLASFCIHHAAEMTQGSSPVQQALVQSFRQQYNNAIECLVSSTEIKSNPSLMILLGKIQMRAKKNKDAVKTFKKALEVFNPADQPTSSTSVKAEIFYLLGLCYMEQFNFLQALDALTSAVKAQPGYCDAYYQRGLCRVRLQQAESLHDFNRALEINPSHFQAYLCRAAFYGSRKRYSKAIMNCNAAIRVQPQSVRAYLYRGVLKYHIKAYKLAILDLTKASELDPTCTLVYYNRGVCYHQIKMYDEALKDYGIAVLLGGWKEVDVKVLVNRGLLYLELQDYANALEDFKAVSLKTPEDTKIHLVIGNCHHRLQQYEESVQSFNHVLQLNPLSSEAYIGRGNAYMEYGHKSGTTQALRDFMKALHLSPRCIAARICLGYNLQAQGFFQRAWNQFTVALDIDACSMLGFEGRAIVSLQMGDTFAALQDMNAALKLSVTAQLLTNRGVIQQFMGKLPNAMRDYQAAITADPTYSLAYFNAANLYLLNRQFSQARDYYTQAVELDPGNESAILNRGITKMLLQDVQGALEDFQIVINLCPVSSAVYFNRASLHNTLQQYQQAESDISQALILQPDDALMYKLRADIRGKMGLPKEAIEDYERAISLLEQPACSHYSV